MDNNLHSNAEEHKSFNGGNSALPNNPFSDDVVVEPSNKSSQHMGYPFSENRPSDTENEESSLGTSSSLFKDDVFDAPLGNFSHSMGEPSDPLAMDNDHRFLASDNLAASTSPFGEVVSDAPMNKVSYGIGSITSDNLATSTSSSSFSDSVDVPLNSSVHVNMGASYLESDNLSTVKDSPIYPSSNVIGVRPSNNTPQGRMGLSFDENGQMPFVDEPKSLTTRNMETQTSPFDPSPSSPFDNPFRREIHDHTRTLGARECSNSPKSSLTSPDSDTVDAPLKYTETNHLSMEKDFVSLTPISTSSNDVDVRPSNNTPLRTMGFSFDQNSQMPIMDEQKPLTTQNTETQTSPFISSPEFPFDDPFRRASHDQTRTPSVLECFISPKSSSTSPDNHRVDAPLRNTETNLLSTEKDSMPLTPITPSTNVVDVTSSSNIPQITTGLPVDKNSRKPFVDEPNPLTTQNTETQTPPFGSSPDAPFDDPFRREIHDQTRTLGGQECTKSPKSSSTPPNSDNVDVHLKYTETNHVSTQKDSMPLTPISPSSDVVDVRTLNNTPQLTMGLSFDKNSQMPNVEEQKPLTTPKMATQTSPSSPSPDSPFNSSKTSNLPVRDQSPPVQVMEHPTTPKYRIPSHVFSRDKSNAPGEWSVASNESLFSIQMGNSFTTDQLALRSGEFNYSSKPCTPIKAAGGYTSPNFGLKESDLKTIDEVSKSGEIQFHEKPRISHESTMSTKSFQFPILADVDKCNSISMTGLAATGTTQKQTQSPTLTAPKPMEVEAEAPRPEPNPSLPAEQPKATTSWFTCFSCCSCWPHR